MAPVGDNTAEDSDCPSVVDPASTCKLATLMLTVNLRVPSVEPQLHNFPQRPSPSCPLAAAQAQAHEPPFAGRSLCVLGAPTMTSFGPISRNNEKTVAGATSAPAQTRREMASRKKISLHATVPSKKRLPCQVSPCCLSSVVIRCQEDSRLSIPEQPPKWRRAPFLSAFEDRTGEQAR